MLPRGVVLGFILIPVLGSEVFAGGGVEKSGQEIDQAQQGVVDETCGEWVPLGFAKVQHNSNI